ncbi:MAG: hypothetical protein CVU51_17305 [Deltaproteobacteria bacterium HGW-Deltaproteobacteria-1]|nr:MAG: hypothetical protein CVU51_17305 [Deltaproteobacteria bacterium HGW-Deltaproteobacteria-1]
MAYVITDECIACGSCEDECPVEAISEGHLKGNIRSLRRVFPLFFSCCKYFRMESFFRRGWKQEKVSSRSIPHLDLGRTVHE